MGKPTCIAITGADGFLGWHIRAFLHAKPELRVRVILEKDFRDAPSLASALGDADAVFHLAGMNRGPDVEVYATNLRLAKVLMEAVDLTGKAPAILFANSTHCSGTTPFGRSKREASAALTTWAKSRGLRYLSLVLPHLFGEGGRPFYNSAFATFCHQLARGETPEVNLEGKVELLHAQRAAANFLELALDPMAHGEVRLGGAPMRVGDVVARLREMSATYGRGIIPNLSTPLDLEFFNTYRSFLYPQRCPVQLTRHSDDRGDLVEVVKTFQGGQTFLSTTHPSITRGCHYHYRKVERFFVIAGQAEIRIRRLLDTEVRCFQVSGDAPCFIDIPTLHTHDITNTGLDELYTLFWSNEIFDPASPDTHPEPVTLDA